MALTDERPLDAVTRTLLLDAHERDHLFTLAGVAPPPALPLPPGRSAV